MYQKFQDLLEEIKNNYLNKNTDSNQMSNSIFELLIECSDLDDVDLLLHYCFTDESIAGLESAKKLADAADLMMEKGVFSSSTRNNIPLSKAIEYSRLAENFAKYSRMMNKEYYVKYFIKAEKNAKNAFDFLILAESIYKAHEYFADQHIDDDFKKMKFFIAKSADLCLVENNKSGLDQLVDMVKDRLKDKELAKSINARKKKIV